jgi:hypothetical protein
MAFPVLAVLVVIVMAVGFLAARAVMARLRESTSHQPLPQPPEPRVGTAPPRSESLLRDRILIPTIVSVVSGVVTAALLAILKIKG